jgi:hypothetical protein
MHFIQKYLVYITIFVVLFSYLEAKRNKHYIKKFKEGNPKTISLLIGLLLFHNILYFGIYFSLPLLIYNFREINSNYLIAYIGLLGSILLSWSSNDGKCWFTVEQNKLLGIDTEYGFSDFIAILSNTHPKITKSSEKTLNLRDKLYWYYIYSAIGITFYLLYLKFNTL